MDEEIAFEMLATIHDTTTTSARRDRFDELIALLRQRLTDVYDHDAHYYLEWLISNALVAGR